MSDSAIAVGVFGSDKAVLATDYVGGAHTLKVTTSAASDGIVVPGFGAAKYIIGTVKTGGVHTLCAATSAANAAIVVAGAGGEKIVLGTVSSGDVHTIAVTTAAPNASVLIEGFGAGLVRLGTVLAAGVHTLAVSTSANGAFAIGAFASNREAMASAVAAGAHSLTLNGLATYVGPLDYRAGAHAVAGTIQFYSSYIGPALRCRNQDTNAEANIDFAGGVLNGTQIDLLLAGSISSLAVVRAYAQDDSGNDYVQLTGSKQPLLKQTGLNGAWVIEFDGVNDCMEAVLTLAQPATLYAIASVRTWLNNGVLFGGYGANPLVQISTPEPALKMSVGAQFAGPASFTKNVWHVMTFVMNGASSAIRHNKDDATAGNGGANGISPGLILGAWGANGANGANSNIAVAGLLVFGAADNTITQNLVIDALGATTGIGV